MKVDISPPDQIYGQLFIDVQSQAIFKDSKTFVDCTAKINADHVLEEYGKRKKNPNFDLKSFVLEFFDLPVDHASGFQSNPSNSASDHIHGLWPILTRKADKQQTGSTLIPLPHPYIVPGGRFGEIYYWDSYFTMLGLQISGQVEMIDNMIKNFAFLIDEVGFIPNGNRSYFATRSQPPFFALMVQLLKDQMGQSVLTKYLPQLLKEHAFWMDGANSLDHKTKSLRRTVLLNDSAVLNRYWDDSSAPRQESYIEDVELAADSGRPAFQLNQDLRAACESGWDFTSRWLEDGKSLGKIIAGSIIPVDLNCLLYNLESTIAEAFGIDGQTKEQNSFVLRAESRQRAIMEYCWDEELKIFQDYNMRTGTFTGIQSLAMTFPLFFKIADEKQATAVAQKLRKDFLKDGGLLTTIYHTGQQWDAPNGWPPLQWMAVKGLHNYGFGDLAREVAHRWTKLCEKVYEESGKFVEKYNVEDIHLKAGGGEYPVQDGFGWSNGVYLKLIEYLTLEDKR